MIDWAAVKQRFRDNASVAGGAATSEPERLAAVFRRRAARLAARKPTAAPAGAIPMLILRLGAEAYGVDLRSVTQVMPFADCTPVPGAPAWLLGVINLRGAICSVVDLANLLNLPEGDAPQGHVMLAGHNERVIGFKVDRFERVERIAVESLRRASQDGGPQSVPHVQGVTAEGVIVLDISQLLSCPGVANAFLKRE